MSSHEQILEGDASFTLVPMTDDEAALWRSQDAEIRAHFDDNFNIPAKYIILQVVQRCPLLDQQYEISWMVDDLLRRHKGLSQAVERCWREGNSTAIRRLSILHFPPPTAEELLKIEELQKKYHFKLMPAYPDNATTRAQDAVLFNRFKGNPHAVFIIMAVVEQSSQLDNIYAQVYEADKLLHRHKGLSELVETCWRTGSLSTIRRLHLLQDWWQ